jgi:hypothetical protein
MKVARCDMCGKDIEPYDDILIDGILVRIHVYKMLKEKSFDLCKECNDKLVDYFLQEAERFGTYERIHTTL